MKKEIILVIIVPNELAAEWRPRTGGLEKEKRMEEKSFGKRRVNEFENKRNWMTQTTMENSIEEGGGGGELE